jgi:hypothetical protein
VHTGIDAVEEGPGVDGRIILKWTLYKWDGEAWTGSIWHRTGTNYGVFVNMIINIRVA